MAETNLQTFLDQIENLAQGNKLRPAIRQLSAYLRPITKDEYRTTIMMMADLNLADDNYDEGILPEGDYNLEVRKLRKRILKFIERLPDKIALLDNLTVPVTQSPVTIDAGLLPSTTTHEKIIGQSTLKNVAWLSKGIEMSKSVCRILLPTPRGTATGTGFLVANGLLYTNNHVLANAAEAGKATIQFNFEEDADGKPLLPVEFKLDPGAYFQTDKTLDFTVVKVDAASNPQFPLEDFGFLDIDPGAIPEKREHVTIIQHPSGGLKQIALTANQVVNVFDYRLQYTTDTMPGSSGSPVFNDKWQVVAIHHAGGSMETNARGDTLFVNEGILFKDIFSHLGI